MPRRLALPVIFTGAPFRTADVDEAGIPRKRLQARDVHHPFRGVSATQPELSLVDRAEALLPLMEQGDAFSHATAALVFGAQLPQRQRSQVLHVSSVGERRMRRPGVVGHRAQQLPLTLHLGLPLVEPAHVWVQLASVLSHEDLVAVGDRWVTPQGRGRERRPAITSIDGLKRAIPARARGAARARRALADVRVGPQSRMETLLRLLLVGSGLPEPVVQPAMRIEGEVLHPDLAYLQWGVVFEYEGDEHRTDQRRWRSDITRRERFEAEGWRVIRVHAGDIFAEPEAFLARVCRILAQRRTFSGSGTL